MMPFIIPNQFWSDKFTAIFNLCGNVNNKLQEMYPLPEYFENYAQYELYFFLLTSELRNYYYENHSDVIIKLFKDAPLVKRLQLAKVYYNDENGVKKDIKKVSQCFDGLKITASEESLESKNTQAEFVSIMTSLAANDDVEIAKQALNILVDYALKRFCIDHVVLKWIITQYYKLFGYSLDADHFLKMCTNPNNWFNDLLLTFLSLSPNQYLLLKNSTRHIEIAGQIITASLEINDLSQDDFIKLTQASLKIFPLGYLSFWRLHPYPIKNFKANFKKIAELDENSLDGKAAYLLYSLHDFYEMFCEMQKSNSRLNIVDIELQCGDAFFRHIKSWLNLLSSLDERKIFFELLYSNRAFGFFLHVLDCAFLKYMPKEQWEYFLSNDKTICLSTAFSRDYSLFELEGLLKQVDEQDKEFLLKLLEQCNCDITEYCFKYSYLSLLPTDFDDNLQHKIYCKKYLELAIKYNNPLYQKCYIRKELNEHFKKIIFAGPKEVEEFVFALMGLVSKEDNFPVEFTYKFGDIIAIIDTVKSSLPKESWPIFDVVIKNLISELTDVENQIKFYSQVEKNYFNDIQLSKSYEEYLIACKPQESKNTYVDKVFDDGVAICRYNNNSSKYYIANGKETEKFTVQANTHHVLALKKGYIATLREDVEFSSSIKRDFVLEMFHRDNPRVKIIERIMKGFIARNHLEYLCNRWISANELEKPTQLLSESTGAFKYFIGRIFTLNESKQEVERKAEFSPIYIRGPRLL